MDPSTMAQALADQIGATVDRHIHPRTGALMPPRLHGQRAVPDAKLGEQVLDLLDELLEEAVAGWRLKRDPEIYLDLCQVDEGWVVAWVVDSGVATAEPEEPS